MKRWLSLLAFPLVLALVSCSGSGSDGDETPTSSASATVTSSASPAPGTATSTATAPGSSPSASVTAGTTATATPGTLTYTVVAGDTLFSIARRYGVTLAALAALNNIADTSQINVGQVLRIPLAAESSVTPSITVTPPTQSPRTPTIPSGAASTQVTNGSRSSSQVALTLDMGGRVEPALDIMNWLIANRVPATIFMTGAMVDNQNTDAGPRVLALVAAHPDLFDLGNHSYTHADFTTLNASQQAKELTDTEASIRKHITVSPRPLFRPPFGAVNSNVLAAVGAVGYGYTIMWDIDTIDWRPESEGGPTAAQVTSKVVTNARGGSIVLMHLGGYNTFEALPQMVAGLRAKGLEPVTISTLLGLP